MIRASLLLVLLAGCASQPPAVCVMPKQVRTGKKTVRAEQWYRFLVDRGLDGKPTDCSGAAVRWEGKPCDEPEEEPTALQPAPFAVDDLIISRVSKEQQLVWIVTQRFSNGDGLGPVALVRGEGDDAEVIITGSLRARTRRARLFLVEQTEGRLLAAEGETCASADPSTCRRSTVLLVEKQNKFVEVPLRTESGACVGPAEFHLTRDKIVPASSGWKRKFELISALTFEKDRILVQENVVVSEFDPTKPGVPPRIDRRADGQRIVRYLGGRLIVNDRSLWARVLEQNGGPG
jgi:hypothetical protein